MKENPLVQLHPPSFTDAYEHFSRGTVAIVHKKYVTTVMAKVVSDFPIPYSHIKRARKSETAEDSVEILISHIVLESDQIEKLELTEAILTNVLIPTRPPRTIEESRFLSSKYWPIQFRKTNTIWLPTDMKTEEMQYLVEAVDSVNKSQQTSMTTGMQPISGGSIECLAKGCHIFLNGKQIARCSWPPAFPWLHPVLSAVNNLSDDLVKSGKRFKHGGETEKSPLSDQYYATGCDVILFGGPCCIMCAMALVHSRVKRVAVIGDRNSHEAWTNSGLGGAQAIQWVTGLNHYFDVYVERSTDFVCACNS